MNQKKILTFVIVLVVLILLVSVGVYFSRNKSKPAETNKPNSEVLSDSEQQIPSFVNEKEITLSPGQTGTFETLSIKFDKVTQDNRCPTSVNCIVAGKVTAQFTLIDDDMARTAAISSDDAEPYSFTNYFVQIKDVQPTKVNPGELDPNSYKITVIVSRNAKL